MEFKEEQKFNQAWLWITLFISFVFTLGTMAHGINRQIIHGIKFGNNPMSNKALVLTFVFVLLACLAVVILLRISNLKVIIDRFGIEFRFFPFHLHYRKIEWDEVESYEVIKYKPLLDYGGWGIRYGFIGKAYNVRGNMGLKLKLKNGKNILFGTQKAEELREFLNKMKTR
jgi:hypothetical protein